jgi:hypothetical protein
MEPVSLVSQLTDQAMRDFHVLFALCMDLTYKFVLSFNSNHVRAALAQVHGLQFCDHYYSPFLVVSTGYVRRVVYQGKHASTVKINTAL